MIKGDFRGKKKTLSSDKKAHLSILVPIRSPEEWHDEHQAAARS